MGENKRATRDGFGDAILEIGKTNPDIYVVDIDIGKSCKTGAFSKELPAQHVNVGIAEQNGAGVAAGLATTGIIPFVVTYAVFGSLRMGEQIRQEVCYPNLNVKIACSHGGVTPANDGASHQSIEDMGVYRTIPNMTVMMPADYYAAKALVKEAAKTYGAMVDLIKRTGRLDLDMDSGTHVDDFPAEIRIFTDNGLICLSITSVYLSGEDNLMVDGYDDDNEKIEGGDVYYDQIIEIVYLAKIILEEMEKKDHGESS